MPIKYKINVIAALRTAGYSTYRIRKENIMSQSTLQKFRNGEIVNADNMALICRLLKCQPGDIIEYVEQDENT